MPFSATIPLDFVEVLYDRELELEEEEGDAWPKGDTELLL